MWIPPSKNSFPNFSSCFVGGSYKGQRQNNSGIIHRLPIVTYDGEMLKEAFIAYKAHLDNKQFNSKLQGKLVNLMSQFGFQGVPKPENLRRLVLEIGHHEFTIKAAGVVYV